MDIVKLNKIVTFQTNAQTPSGAGTVDSYTTLLTTRGNLSKIRSGRNLLTGEMSFNGSYYLMVRFTDALYNAIRTDMRVIIENVYYTIDSWEKTEEKRFYIKFVVNRGEAIVVSTISLVEEIANAYQLASSSTYQEKGFLVEYLTGVFDLGLQNKIVSAFPFVGSTEPKKRFDLFNIHNALVPFGTTPTSVATGVSINNDSGVSGYNTGIIPGNLSIRELTNIGIGWYHPVSVNSIVFNGGQITLITDDGGSFYPYLAGDVSLNYTFPAPAVKDGHFYVERPDLLTVRSYQDNVLITPAPKISQPENGFGVSELKLSIRTGNGVPGIYSFFYVTNFLTTDERNAHDALIQTLMTNLNRHAA